MKTLTMRDMETIRRALNCAMEDRASFADAQIVDDKIRRGALAEVLRFERLHVKLFGRKSRRQEIIDEFAAAPMVSIYELANRKEC